MKPRDVRGRTRMAMEPREMIDTSSHNGQPLPWFFASLFAVGAAMAKAGINWGLLISAVGATALLLQAVSGGSREIRAWLDRRSRRKPERTPEIDGE